MRNLFQKSELSIISIDEQIELSKRMDCAKGQVITRSQQYSCSESGRENEILDAIEERGGQYGSYARLLYSNIMELSRALTCMYIVGSDTEYKELSAMLKPDTENRC